MKKPAPYCLIFLWVILFCNCKTDDPAPLSKITIYAPVANTPYEVFDTAEIKLMVESPQPEVSLRISLLNHNYTPMSPPNALVISNFKTGVETSLDFLLDNYYLESDNYYLQVKVTDNSGSVNAYRSIYIEGIQRQFEGVFIISELTANQTRLEKLDTDFSNLNMLDFQGNYDLDLAHWIILLANTLKTSWQGSC